MSTSTDGILAYGYDLGGGDGEFNLVDGDGYTPSWFDEDGNEVPLCEEDYVWWL